MAAEEEVSDGELVRRLCGGDRQALAVLYARNDSDVLDAVRWEFGRRPDAEHRAREVVDLLWSELSRHPHYLSRHDCARRPLSAYLINLGRRKAKRFLGVLVRKEIAHPEPRLEQDLVDPLEELIKRWDQVVDLLSAGELTRLRRVLARTKRSEADQAWYDRLVRRLRQQLDLGPRTGCGNPFTDGSEKLPKKPNF